MAVINRVQQKSAEQRLKELDDIMKKNRGGMTLQGFEASPYSPNIIPGRKVLNPTGLNESAFQIPKFQSQQQDAGYDFQDYQLPQYQSDGGYPGGSVLGYQTGSSPNVYDFINAFTQSISAPQMPTSGDLEQLQSATGRAYPVQSRQDGSVLYSDGSIRGREDSAYPIATMQDGSILWSDGFLRKATPNMGSGVSGLSTGLFGRDQAVTQEYGNYNPGVEPGSGYNLGTDFRTRDLNAKQIYFPVSAEVVDIKTDDGTRFGDISGHQGYGNSVLLRLSTGEMLRLSHLDDLGNISVGSTIKPGEYVGTAGQTGNTYGEHLDVEYYDQNGQIADLSNFQGFSNPQAFSSNADIVGFTPYNQDNKQPEIRQEQTQSVEQPRIETPEVVKKVQSTLTAPVRAGKVLGETVGADTRGLSRSIEKANLTPRIDLGISEFLRGDTAGAKQNFIDTASRLSDRANEAFDNAGRYIGEKANEIRPELSTIKKNIFDIGSDLGARAGQGLDKLKGAVNGISGIVSNTLPQSPRAVGDVSGSATSAGGSLLDTAQSLSSRPQNDTRDPFFKSGAVNQYSSQLQEGVDQNYKDSLSTNLFKDSFFQDLGNIQNVFGGTFLENEATNKYNAYVEEKRRQEEEKRRAEEEARRREEASKPKPTLQDYLNQGKTAAQWYAETGQQSTLDSIRRDPTIKFDDRTGAIASQEPKQATSQAVTQAIQSAGQGKTYTSPSGNKIQNYTPSGANMTDASTGLAVIGSAKQPAPQMSIATPKQSSNVFSNLTSKFFNIFK